MSKNELSIPQQNELREKVYQLAVGVKDVLASGREVDFNEVDDYLENITGILSPVVISMVVMQVPAPPIKERTIIDASELASAAGVMSLARIDADDAENMLTTLRENLQELDEDDIQESERDLLEELENLSTTLENAYGDQIAVIQTEAKDFLNEPVEQLTNVPEFFENIDWDAAYDGVLNSAEQVDFDNDTYYIISNR